MPDPSPDPSELRMVLSENLKRLSKDAGSISDICRRIGVNRTQFNRYLSGSAFPRPDVLFRICRHFGVDANILLYPIKDKPTPPAAEPAPWLGTSQRPFDHYLLPDGFYKYWRKSFRQPSRAYQGMALITTRNDAKLWKGYDLHDQPLRPGGSRHARSARYDGRLIQQFDGFTLISRTPYTDVMNMTYFEYGLDGLLDFYSGISFVTRRRMPETNRISTIVMTRLAPRCRDILDCARSCGSMDMDALPQPIQSALHRIPDRI